MSSKSYFTKPRKINDVALVGGIALVLSIIATYYCYLQGYILAYGDAESHLDIAKRVVNGLQPGFGQLGGIWLPLHHLLMVPFVWNDFLWRSGLAGSFVSMAAYILAAVYVFKLSKEITGSRFGGYTGAAIFGLNPGILYMQSTPMSELLLIAAMVASIYHLYMWVKYDQLTSLILAAIFCTAGTLVRYDAWFLAFAEIGVVILVSLYRRWKVSRVEGTTILFSVVALSGIALWIMWSLAIFKQPAYFLTSQYSAKSQQQGFAARGELITAHSAGNSLLYYADAVWENAGAIFSIVACIGLIAFIILSVKKRSHRVLILPAILLLVPFAFNVLSLYMGISILFMPALVPQNFEWRIFNVRYGLLMVPAVAVFAAYAFSRVRYGYVLMTPLIGMVLVVMFIKIPIVLQDGLTGLSTRTVTPAERFVAANYDYGNIVFDDFSRVAKPIALMVPDKNIIYIGYPAVYARAVSNPVSTVRWIIIKQNPSDSFWIATEKHPEILKPFDLVFSYDDTRVYKLKPASERLNNE